jgi:hypothetical protein
VRGGGVTQAQSAKPAANIAPARNATVVRREKSRIVMGLQPLDPLFINRLQRLPGTLVDSHGPREFVGAIDVVGRPFQGLAGLRNFKMN